MDRSPRSTALSALGRGLVSAGCRMMRIGRDPGMTVLMYHQVLESIDPLWRLEAVAEDFRRHMATLRDYFRPISVSQALAEIRDGRVVPGSVCVTFDDGFANNHDVALPILVECGIPATFFTTTAFVEGGCMWSDRVVESIRAAPEGEIDLTGIGDERRALNTVADRRAVAHRILRAIKYLDPDARDEAVAEVERRAGVTVTRRLMMTAGQLRALDAAGMEIGGHTRSHPILANLDAVRAAEEIGGAKEELEGILGHRIRYFAYPNGKRGDDYSDREIDLVRAAGFECAFTTEADIVDASVDPFQIPRFASWDRHPLRFGLRLIARQSARPF